jgi:hypothetical protein
MKKHFRYLTLLPLLLTMVFATALSSASQPAAAKGDLDPECQNSCFQELQLCVFAATKNSEENQCFARYRHCIAHCKQ